MFNNLTGEIYNYMVTSWQLDRLWSQPLYRRFDLNSAWPWGLCMRLLLYFPQLQVAALDIATGTGLIYIYIVFAPIYHLQKPINPFYSVEQDVQNSKQLPYTILHNSHRGIVVISTRRHIDPFFATAPYIRNFHSRKH